MTYNIDSAMFSCRYSCRAYSGEKAEKEKLLAVMEAARLAPSACNRQPWLFAVAESDDARQAVAEAYDREWIRQAPQFIIAYGRRDHGWHRPCDGKDHTDVDVAIAVEHICLAAASLGLGTCWVCNFDPEKIKAAIAAGDSLDPIAIIPIGYPAQGAVVPEKKRKPLDEIMKFV